MEDCLASYIANMERGSHDLHCRTILPEGIQFFLSFFLNYLDREKAASAEAVLQLRPVYNIPYSGYNLRGAIFAIHQISHLAVIFAIIKFANHCMYRITFVSIYIITR